MNLKELVQSNLEEIKILRCLLHENAELSYQEFKTQEILIDFFKNLNMSTKKTACTGLIATLNDLDTCIALRADMDALPVNGVSHVCGHDYHMAIACGVALVLKKLDFKKTVKFIFQPGEEAEGGALPMINEGVLNNPKVDNMIGFHVWPNLKVGTIEAAAGASMASVDDFKIVFKGKGGHAATPHLCNNPMYPAIDFIETINRISRQEINPLHSHVITFSSIQCGNTPNVIADECSILGTVRTFSNDLRNKIYEDMQRIAELCAKKYNCESVTEYKFEYPPLINDASYTNTFIDVTKALIGESNVLPLERTFAAEDFAFFAEKVRSVHFRLGIADNSYGFHPLHSTKFDASEESIFHGILIITNFILSMSDK